MAGGGTKLRPFRSDDVERRRLSLCLTYETTIDIWGFCGKVTAVERKGSFLCCIWWSAAVVVGRQERMEIYLPGTLPTYFLLCAPLKQLRPPPPVRPLSFTHAHPLFLVRWTSCSALAAKQWPPSRPLRETVGWTTAGAAVVAAETSAAQPAHEVEPNQLRRLRRRLSQGRGLGLDR